VSPGEKRVQFDFSSLEMLFLVFFTALISYVRGGLTNGRYRGSNSWIYLDRFCFAGGDEGHFRSEFLFPMEHKPILMLYYLENGAETEWGSWERVYNGNLNCTERYEISQNTSGSVFHLSSFQYRKGIETIDGDAYVRAEVRSTISSSRSRWFFFAVGNCPLGCTDAFCAGGVDIYWSSNFTNGDSGNFYFGSDESSVWATSITFVILYALLLIYAVHVRNILLQARKYHFTVRLVVASTVLSSLRVFCDALGLTSFRSYGLVKDEIFAASYAFGGLAEFALILMLLLIMKGWTIVRRKISANGRMRISIFMMLYFAVYWACIVYFRNAMDPAAVVYLYDTWPGHMLVILRVILVLWLIRAQMLTVKKYNSKRGFYWKFVIFAVLWATSLPLMVLLNYGIADYFRAKLLYGIELTVMFVTQAMLIALYNPHFIGASFPFHATTAAMLHSKANGAPADTASISQVQLRQASEIGGKIRQGITVLQTFTSDLTSFLEEIDPGEQELLEQDEDLAGSRPTSIANGKIPHVASSNARKARKRSKTLISPR